jgi:hypothetical protein
MIVLFVFSLGMVASAANVAHGVSKVWVSSAGATLKADKSASSATVASLPIGTELRVLSYRSPWYEVSSSSGKRGWIYRGKVSTTPPEGEEQGGGSLFSALPGSGISSGSADTSRSIRGLSPEASAYAKDTDQPSAYRTALDRVLNLKVTDEALEKFLKSGRIGEYAQ